MILHVFLTALVGCCSALIPIQHPHPTSPRAENNDYLLPAVFHVSSYTIRLVPFIAEGNFTFSGDVVITLRPLVDVTNVTLHANQLVIDSAKVRVKEVAGDVMVPVASTEKDLVKDFYVIMLGESLRAGVTYTTEIRKFTGMMGEDMLGFYRSSYSDKDGKTKWLGSTQFEPTHARRAFPCFDEPSYKSIFQLSISRTQHLRAISNMPQRGQPQPDTEHVDEPRFWDHFLPTPLMSSYLLAFVVSDFAYLSDPGNRLRVFAPPPVVQQARYSLRISPSILTWLGEYTGIPFNLPKIDEVAVPDFELGAMENWGLVTYRQKYILYADGVSSTHDAQKIATTIAHEYSHQWFGDLVTPSWWKYIWLNEGFATYFEYHAVAQLQPSWRMEEQFVVDCMHTAMSVDASQKSHAMSHDVASPTDIASLFDSISYVKSGSVLRMLRFILSEATFRRGLNRYLTHMSRSNAIDLVGPANDQLHEDVKRARTDVDVKRVVICLLLYRSRSNANPDNLFSDLNDQLHEDVKRARTDVDVKRVVICLLLYRSRGNANPDNLFSDLNDQLHEDVKRVRTDVDMKMARADVDVKRVMDTWTLQMGYPVVTVKRNYATNTAEISQERFLLSRIRDEEDKNDYKWEIPLTFTTRKKLDFEATSPRSWLHASEASKTVGNMPGSDQWVLFNIQQSGFYRVNYDDKNWALLRSHLDSDKFHEIHGVNRAQIINDAFNLARAGHVEYGTALGLSRYLARETNYIPWAAAFNNFAFIDNKISTAQEYPVFQGFMLRLLDSLYKSVGFDEHKDDGHIRKMNRAAAVFWACHYGYIKCIEWCSAKLAQWMAAPENNPINANLRKAVYCNGIANGGAPEWAFLWKQYLVSDAATETSTLLAALGCSTNRRTLTQYLEMSISEDVAIRRQDIAIVFSSVSSNVEGVDVALDFLIANLQKISKSIGGTSLLGKLLIGLSHYCNTQEQADKLKKFRLTQEVKSEGIEEEINQAIAIVEQNLRWQQTFGQEIIRWIKKN